MELNDFYEYFALLSSTFQVKNIKNNVEEKLKWQPVKWLRYIKDNLGTRQYKNTLDVLEPFKYLKLLKKE